MSSIGSTARRSHRKSKSGCANCKRRKIKCDEQKPECRNCLKHAIRCDFSGTAASPSNSSTLSSGHCTPTLTVDDRMSISSCLAPIGGSLSGVNLVHLELLHHYSTATCNTLGRHPVLRTMWRHAVPKLAFRKEFLMREIFACTALHIAHCRPHESNRWVKVAAAEHELALREVNTILPNVTPENCSEIFLFSQFTCLYSSAYPRKPGFHLFDSGDGSIFQWVTLFRGMREIITSSMDTLLTGPFGSLFRIGATYTRNLRDPPPKAAHPELLALRHLIVETFAEKDPELMRMYTLAIDQLGQIYEHDKYLKAGPQSSLVLGSSEVEDLASAECMPSTCFVWLYRVDGKFLKLLSEHAQEALSVFAFFALLTRNVSGIWWMKCWEAEQLISAIYGLLDYTHRAWIRWPMEQIGWLPS